MMMKYGYLKYYPKVFQAMTGLSVQEYDQLCEEVLPLYKAAEEERLDRPGRKRDLGGGRKASLSVVDQLLLTVIWLRLYPTQDVLGYFFGVSQSAVSHYIDHALPVLEQAGRDSMRMPDPGGKRRPGLSDLLEALPDIMVVIDSFEQKVQRPPDKDQQKRYYSGKKKQHTLKSQVAVDEASGMVVDVAESVPGPTADFKLLQQSGLLGRLPAGVGGMGDLGYTGIETLHPWSAAPRRKPRGRARPAEDIQYNTAFAQRRVIVENSIGRMRRYQSITQADRQHRQLHTPRVVAVAGLVNRQIAHRLVH